MEIFFIGNKQEFYSSKIQYCTIQDAFEYLNTQKFIGIDIETSYKFPVNTFPNEKVYQPGLDPYLSRVVMLQLGTLDKIFVIDTRTESINALLPLWNCKDRMWIGHNLKFEAKHLKHNYSIVFHKIWDTMLVDQNLTNGLNLGYSLEKLANRYLFKKSIGTRDLFSTIDDTEDESDYIDKSIRMGFLHIGDKPFTEEQIIYGVNDIVYPITIREHQRLGINGYAPSKLHKLECDFCLVLADIELKGITFDKDKWIDTYNINKVVFDRRLEKLNTYVEKNYLDFCAIPDLFNPTASGRCLIEWSSSKQVIELFKKLKFCPKEKSKQTGNIEYTVGAKSLLKLLNNEYKEKYNFDVETDIVTIEDLILNYLLFKVTEQSCTTFGIEWLKYIHPITGRIHSSFKQILNTGRMCVDVDTLIDTNIGYIRIGDLIPTEYDSFITVDNGIKAKTHTGEYKTITHAYNKGVEDMYKVTLESGHEIVCTLEHKFLTEKGWYSLKDLLSLHSETPILYDSNY